MAFAGAGHDLPGGPLSDPAARCGDRASERLRVGGVGDQRQVGERVAHLGALIQAERAEHPVGDAGARECGLHGHGRVAGARQQQDLRGRCARRELLGDRRGAPGGLVALAGERGRGSRVRRRRASRSASWGRGRGCFVCSVRRRARISARERKLRASTIRSCAGKRSASRASPCASAPRNAYSDWSSSATTAEIPVRACEQRDEHRLCLAGVLVFVDHDPAPPSAVELEVVRVLCQQPHRADEQVVEVHGV